MHSKRKYDLAIFIISFFIFTITLISGCSEDDSGSNNNGGGGNPGANEVFMQGNAFTPSNRTVSAGTTVKWINKDGTTHNVIGDGNAFTSGDMGQNAEYTHQFTTAGTYNYHCSHHSGMSGVITVQ